MSSRTEIWNGYEDALASELSAGDLTNLFVGSIPTGWVGPVYLCIEPDKPTQREWIRANVLNQGLARFETLTRNLEGSVGDISHPANSIVRAIVTRQLTNDLFTDIEAVELSGNQHATDGGDPHSQAGYLKQTTADILYVNLSGDTMTGFLTLFADPTNPFHAATKSYVDASGVTDHDGLSNVTTAQHHTRYADSEAVSAMGVTGDGNDLNHNRYTDADAVSALNSASVYLRLDGTTAMGNSLNMGVQRIINLANGLTDTDAATIKDVDDRVDAIAIDSYTKAEVDANTYTRAQVDAIVASYYTLSTDTRAIAGRRIFLSINDPGAISNGDIWHDLP